MKNKTTQGLGNKNSLSFPKHDSLKYSRLKSNGNSHMSIQYVNQSESLSDHFPICQEANGVSKESTWFFFWGGGLLTLQSYYIKKNPKKHTAMIEGLDNRTRIPY